MPRQFVNESSTDTIVGNQMKKRHRKVGIPTMSASVVLSRRVSSEYLRPAARLDDRPAGRGTGRGGCARRDRS